MSEKVAKLYDALFEIEHSLKHKNIYPIHKRLNLKSLGYLDIYDYVLKKYIGLKGDLHILDAGCGVGYGSVFLAQNSSHKITGISISPKEINQGQKVVKRQLISNCDFELKDFLSLGKRTFDVIVCVESLKHAKDINNVLKTLINHLNPCGKIILVEDVFVGNLKTNSLVSKYQDNWILSEVLNSNTLQLKGVKVKEEDLTPLIKTGFHLSFFVRKILVFVSALLKDKAFKQLFWGGIQLEQLYRNKQMKYQLIQFTK